MKITLKTILAAVFAVFLLCGYDLIFYTPYVPVYRYSDPDHTMEEKPSLLTTDHKKYIQIIFENNNEKFHKKDSELYIKRSLKWDVDLLSNYTMKAIYLEKTSSPKKTRQGKINPAN